MATHPSIMVLPAGFQFKMKAGLGLFVLLLSFRTASADGYPVNKNIDIRHYAFEINLSDSTDEIHAVARVTVFFRSGNVNQFSLDLVNRSDSLKGRGMVVESVTEDEKPVDFLHESNRLQIRTPFHFPANAVLIFTIRYYGIPADGLHIGPTRYGQRSFFSNNWPNKARNWLPTIDHPYEKASSEFIVKAPSQYQVISNGLLVEETNLGSGMKLTHWKQSVPVSCWLYVLGVARFAVQYAGRLDGKSVQTWVYPEDRKAGFYDFAGPTKPAFDFFSDYVGRYVFEKIANVECPVVGGGMEAPSAIFYAENLVNGKRDRQSRDVIVHELAHQWFGDAVTESSWDDVWLSEGFATFFTLLFTEHRFGGEAYRAGLLKAKKMIYAYYAKDTTYSIIANRTAETGPVTNYAITYQKGAWVLHMLRERVGRDAFKKSIRSYYRHFLNAGATTDDFRHEMERASGLKLRAFFSQWLYHSENPELEGSWNYNRGKKQITIHLKQVQPDNYIFRLPLEFAVYTAGSRLPEIFKFNLHAKQAKYIINLDEKPVKLIPDPRTVLLATFSLKEGNPDSL